MRPRWPADKLRYRRPSLASRHEGACAAKLNEDPISDLRTYTRRQARSFLGVFVIALLLGGCTGGILDPKGPVGSAQRLILFDALAIMLAVVVPVIVAILAFAWWYRASNSKARYLGDWAYSGRIEFIVWAIPALVIMFLGGIAWISSHDLDPAKALPSKARSLEVQVVSLDWKWLFIYPEQGVASVNQLVVPAGVPVHFSLTSASVMNAFFVPQLGTMIYTMNGMMTQLNLQADEPGVFHGLSSQYSGDGFSGMAFEVRAVSSGDFDNWIAAARRAGPELDAQSYAMLARQSTNVAPFTYRAVGPQLFNSIVTRELPPGPGPDMGKPGANVSPRTGG
ncbi:MAG: cytochrome o ubiquinol oxidase subunit [Bradyrhizobium sp.]|nr:cytochrome o ubiquinol oxidase subunit [Bradyrhizobium sp.]